MAITVNQIPTALQIVSSLEQNICQLNALLFQAQILAANGWVYNIAMGTGQSPVNVTVTAGQQAAMIAQYDALKTTLASLYGQLP